MLSTEERQIPVEHAIEIALTWAKLHELNLSYQTVYSSPHTASITVTSTLANKEGIRLSQASGKGFGEDAIASALYEAIEHAAIKQSLPGMIPDNHNYVLPPNSFIESIDVAYTLARKFSSNQKQPLTVFYELNADLSLNLDRPVLFPRITCDLSTKLNSDMGNLLSLSSYATNTGTASGTCWTDAATHAINEVIERDAESQFLLDINMGKKTWKAFLPPTDSPESMLFNELTIKKGKEGALFLLQSEASGCGVINSVTV